MSNNEETQDWTAGLVDGLRKLADGIEQAGELKQGDLYGITSTPFMVIHTADYESVDNLATKFEATPYVITEYDPIYRADLNFPGLRVDVRTKAITVPRACDYCDQKHDCTHRGGEIA